jgi:hypothetical protein
MNKFKVIQISAILILAGALGGMMIETDVYGEIQRQITSVLCLSCAKLNYKTVVEFQFETANGIDHPHFVLENLTKGVVFLHYSADACHGCDIIEPMIKDFFDVEYDKQEMFYAITTFEDSDIPYIYNNVDHTTREMQDSYHIYDVDGQGARPMIVFVTLNYDRGTIRPYYAPVYGTFGDTDKQRVDFLTNALQNSIELYNEFKSGYNP